MKERLYLDLQRKLAAKNSRQKFHSSLDEALGPAELLGLESVHFNGQFCRADNVWKIEKIPADHLSPVTEIGVFRQRVVLPATCGFNGLAPPDSRRSVEIEKPSG